MRSLLLPTLTLALAAQSPEARLRKDLAFLTSDALQGRGNGSPELMKAAAFVTRRHQALGLHPVTVTFPFPSKVEVVAARATYGTASWVAGRDFQPLGLSGEGDVPPSDLAFLGYGTRSGAYDEFKEMDLKGRLAVIRRRMPDLPALAHLSPVERSLTYRLRRIQEAGASGILVIEEEDAPRPTRIEEASAPLGIPVISIRRDLLEGPFGLSDRFAAIAETGLPQTRSGEEVPRVSLSVALRRKEGPVPTVASLLRGRDPQRKEEVVVLGAHLDHLGLGERHSLGGATAFGKVHPGADDNASGSALLLELARRFARKPARRPILALHFGGEEEGLLGSQHWLKHPTTPLEQLRFMVNFDMVGRLTPAKPSLSLGGLGAPKQAVDRAAALAPEGWAVGRELGASVGGSDHMSFAQAKIPTFFFFTGLHDAYHRPTDTADRIDPKGMALLADFAEKVVRDLADGEALPPFDPETAKLPAQSRSPMRIAFGTIPDYSPCPEGFRISGVAKGGTAEALGLQGGDILTSFGGRPLKDIQDYMAALGTFAPGDQVVVTWIRAGKPMEGKATLKGRD